MNGIWLISYLGLWLVVIVLMLAVAALARQIGLLHKRLMPVPARMENSGPRIGEVAPEISATDLEGRAVSLSDNGGKPTLMVFMSATCSTCNDLAPALRSIYKSEGDSLRLLLVSLGGDEKMNRDFVAHYKLKGIHYVLSKKIGFLYEVPAPPYALLIDEHRVVKAKGVVNHLDNLESLLNAASMGYPSMESWVQDQQGKPQAMM